jgi:hypothetical protein
MTAMTPHLLSVVYLDPKVHRGNASFEAALGASLGRGFFSMPLKKIVISKAVQRTHLEGSSIVPQLEAAKASG